MLADCQHKSVTRKVSQPVLTPKDGCQTADVTVTTVRLQTRNVTYDCWQSTNWYTTLVIPSQPTVWSDVPSVSWSVHLALYHLMQSN